MAAGLHSVLDLPYDIHQRIFTELSPVDVFHFISASKALYHSLIDDTSTWRPFCLPFGISDNDAFRGRSFRIIYTRLLHKYISLLGWWCSDYPCRGNIIEFRLLPDHWMRAGEPIIVGDAWRFTVERGQNPPLYPSYVEFMQIGFTPPDQSTPDTANDVHITWHLRSERERNLSFPLIRGDSTSLWIAMDGTNRLATYTLHAIAPSSVALQINDHPGGLVIIPEFPDSTTAAWLDNARGVPRLPLEEPPPTLESHIVGWRSILTAGDLKYVDGVPKPASISFFPPPSDQPSDVRIPDLHKPPHSLSLLFQGTIPRYYPLRNVTQEGMDPALPSWRPESVVGLWLGDYRTVGTECVFLDYDATTSLLRATKITGDVNVPRGVCSWQADLSMEEPWEDEDAGQTYRAYEGIGHVAQHGFIDTDTIPAHIIMRTRDEILVEWEGWLIVSFIRYRKERGRTGDQ